MTGPGLVIFDCDGVLVDSEVISASVLAAQFAEIGLPIDEADVYAKFLGRSMVDLYRTVDSEHGVALGDDFIVSIRDGMQRRLESELQPIRGVAAALAQLQAPVCVASSSRPERLQLSLGVTGLIGFFSPHIFSATMVRNGKPAPDLFLHAAGEMGVAPQHCVVVEDSPAGVEAAKRAGMRVFAFTGGTHATRFDLASALAALHPDVIFDDMLRLPGLLAEEPRVH